MLEDGGRGRDASHGHCRGRPVAREHLTAYPGGQQAPGHWAQAGVDRARATPLWENLWNLGAPWAPGGTSTDRAIGPSREGIDSYRYCSLGCHAPAGARGDFVNVGRASLVYIVSGPQLGGDQFQHQEHVLAAARAPGIPAPRNWKSGSPRTPRRPGGCPLSPLAAEKVPLPRF